MTEIPPLPDAGLKAESDACHAYVLELTKKRDSKSAPIRGERTFKKVTPCAVASVMDPVSSVCTHPRARCPSRQSIRETKSLFCAPQNIRPSNAARSHESRYQLAYSPMRMIPAWLIPSPQYCVVREIDPLTYEVGPFPEDRPAHKAAAAEPSETSSSPKSADGVRIRFAPAWENTEQ